MISVQEGEKIEKVACNGKKTVLGGAEQNGESVGSRYRKEVGEISK
jgi:hypothetical protein